MASTDKTHKKIRLVVLWLLAITAIVVYVARAFLPGQPIHHELNDAGGALIVAWILVAIFA